jgi:hypothetical protein
MIKVHFSTAGLQRIVVENRTAPGREFDLAALIAMRPYILAADRALGRVVSNVVGAGKKAAHPE